MSKTLIVDRRNEPGRHKFGKDKARFLHRIRAAVRKAVQDKVSQGSIKDFEKGGVKIPIPKKSTTLPVIHHAQGPYFKKVFPGNLFTEHDSYDVGDIVPVPAGGGGGGSGQGQGPKAGDGDDSEDDFIWLPQDEFLDIFFEGRQLPDMNKLHDQATHITKRERAGKITKGPSHRMDMRITDRKRRKDEYVLNKAAERRLMENLTEQYGIYAEHSGADLPALDLEGKDHDESLEEVERVFKALSAQFNTSAQEPEEEKYKNPALTKMFNCVQLLDDQFTDLELPEDEAEWLEILRERVPEQLKAKQDASKFQNRHRTYHFDEDKPTPAAKAVMFCKMDVSGSMGEYEKNTAKAFFWLLHRFLKENYEEVDVVFITHTTTAEEVDEQEFFYGTRTGGTLVSSCLEKELEIIQERYPVGEWNIYSAQASDGDNDGRDNALVQDLMRKIMPLQQASYFIEVEHEHWRRGQKSNLHLVYDELKSEFPHLFTAMVESPADALEAFKTFFPVGGQPKNELALG